MYGNIGLLDIYQQVIDKVSNINRNTIANTIIPVIMKNIRGTVYSNDDGGMDGEIVIAYKNKAYAITGNYNVIEIEDIYTMGSGGTTAFGSLFTSKYTNMTPESRVMIAIKSAGNRISTVSKEAYIGDTSGSPFTQINTINYSEK